MFKSGFVTIIGRPNVGKSTLMNGFVGSKIAIMSSKPQTTRNRIQAVLTTKKEQVVFIDTPGIHKPQHKLGEFMNTSAISTIKEVDAVLMLVELDKKPGLGDKYIIEKLADVKTPVILVINKIDTVKKAEILPVIEAYKDLYDWANIIPVSALYGENKESLLEAITSKLSEGPMFFPDGYVTDQPERQLVSELIREKALFSLKEEVPHGIAVVIEDFGNYDKFNESDKLNIHATIICEKKSHKPIILGKGGAMIKRIGVSARFEIERLLGQKVNLKLWVKVKDRWRDSDMLMRNYGYDSRNLR